MPTLVPARFRRAWTEADWNKEGYVDAKRDHLFVKEAEIGAHCCGRKITIQNCARPHGRAFHVAWFAFFCCFIMWFAIPPLMVTIKKPPCASPDDEICMECATLFDSADDIADDSRCRVCAPYADGNGKGCGGLGLSSHQIVVSNAVAVAGTILVRILIGPLADSIGVRVTYSLVLILFSIPGFLATTVRSYELFVTVRFFIGLVGGSFVLTQLWTMNMFHSNVVGLANATSAGWGNLGASAALAINGAVFRAIKHDGFTNDQAWRRTLAWPPAALVLTGIFAFLCTDDNPYGNHFEWKRRVATGAAPGSVDASAASVQAGAEPTGVAARSLQRAAKNWRTWVLFFIYAWSFGVELVVNSNIALYFSEAYAMSQADGGLAGALFGLFNLFARSLGGYVSDKLNWRYGERGRLWALFLCAWAMGLLMIGFAVCTKDRCGVEGALSVLGGWALFLAMTEGAVFAVVPYVDASAMGGVAGLVGAGGNCGALAGNFIVGIGTRPGFLVLGYLSAISALLVPLLWLPGAGSMMRGEEWEEADEEEASGSAALGGSAEPLFPGPGNGSSRLHPAQGLGGSVGSRPGILSRSAMKPSFGRATSHGTGVVKLTKKDIRVKKEPLGEGAFKAVYRGTLIGDHGAAGEDGASVAVLVLRGNREMSGRVVKALETLAKHPNLTRLLGTIETDGAIRTLVTELCELGDVGTLLRKMKADGQEASSGVLTMAAIQVCDAMMQLVHHRMLHRNLSLRNVMAFSLPLDDPQGVLVKVTDHFYADVKTAATPNGKGGAPPRTRSASREVSFESAGAGSKEDASREAASEEASVEEEAGGGGAGRVQRMDSVEIEDVEEEQDLGPSAGPAVQRGGALFEDAEPPGGLVRLDSRAPPPGLGRLESRYGPIEEAVEQVGGKAFGAGAEQGGPHDDDDHHHHDHHRGGAVKGNGTAPGATATGEEGGGAERPALERVASRVGNGLPLRWMAPEAVEHGRWSEMTDIWAYGVTVWELFSHGEEPYGDIGEDREAARQVIEEGLRLQDPPSCPALVLEAVKGCFSADAQFRPTFANVRLKLWKALPSSPMPVFVL